MTCLAPLKSVRGTSFCGRAGHPHFGGRCFQHAPVRENARAQELELKAAISVALDTVSAAQSVFLDAAETSGLDAGDTRAKFAAYVLAKSWLAVRVDAYKRSLINGHRQETQTTNDPTAPSTARDATGGSAHPG